MEHIDVKGIIFDYGGTIDSHGDHWSEIIWDGYRGVGIGVGKEEFRQAYVYAERELARVRHIRPEHTFLDLLTIKMRIELRWLAENGAIAFSQVEPAAQEIASYCYSRARESVEDARRTLDALYGRYRMVLVSNFYGNIESVLKDFDLLKYFESIVESAVVGVRKPDPGIFRLGVEALRLEPQEVLVVGDSLRKDILPAESIGCKTAWLKGKGWTAEEDAATHPSQIKSLDEVAEALLRLNNN